MPIYLDARWIGPHGIGRYAKEVLARTGFAPLPLRGNPLGPWDPVRLKLRLNTLNAGHFFHPGLMPRWGGNDLLADHPRLDPSRGSVRKLGTETTLL